MKTIVIFWVFVVLQNILAAKIAKDEGVLVLIDDNFQEILETDEFSTEPPKEGSFKSIKCLSTNELKAKLQNLDHEMELKIEQITRRYHTKRQPILDGINEIRKQQHNF